MNTIVLCLCLPRHCDEGEQDGNDGFLVHVLIKFDSEDVIMRAVWGNVRDTTATAGYLILRIIPE